MTPAPNITALMSNRFSKMSSLSTLEWLVDVEMMPIESDLIILEYI